MEKDDEDEDEVMKRSDFISSCMHYQAQRARSVMTALTLHMMAMILTVCATVAILGCVLLTTGDHSLNLLTLLRILSPRVAVACLPSKMPAWMSTTWAKAMTQIRPDYSIRTRPTMLMMAWMRATHQTRLLSHQAPQSIYDMTALVHTYSSLAGTMSAALKAMRTSQ
jgi:hypothetical protein